MPGSNGASIFYKQARIQTRGCFKVKSLARFSALGAFRAWTESQQEFLLVNGQPVNKQAKRFQAFQK